MGDTSAYQCRRVYRAKLSHSTHSVLFTTEVDECVGTTWRKGRGTVHRWKADIKRDARRKRKRPNTQPWGTSNPDSSLSHEVATREKHAGDLQETNRTQSSPAIRFALLLLLKLTEFPLFFSFYLVQKTRTSVLSFSKIWILTLHERRK